MRRPLTIVAAATLGFATGYLVFHGMSVRAAADSASSRPSSRDLERISAEAGMDELAHTFDAFHKSIDRLRTGPPLRGRLERLSNRELREWATWDWPAGQTSASGGSPNAVVMGLIAELLYEREGLAAIEWADQQPEHLRDVMLRKMVLKAAENDPVAAKPWVDKVMSDYGRISNYANAAERGARQRGAEDLAAVYDTYPGLGASGFGYEPFARDFDFKKLADLAAGKHFISSAYAAWASRDAEAAAADVIGRCGSDPRASRFAGALFKGVAAVRGDDDAASWIVAKLEELPRDSRAEAVKALRGNEILTASEVDAMFAALPTPEDRMLYAGEVVSPFGNREATRRAIAALGTAEARTELLLRIAPQYRAAASRGAGGRFDPVSFFQDTMKEWNLPETARHQVMESLMNPPVIED